MSLPDKFFAGFPDETQASRSTVLDYIYDTLDDWMLEGNGTAVDEVLDRVDVDSCELVYLIGYLTITGQWKHKLTKRDEFYNRVRSRVLQEEPERVIPLLQGLR